MRILIRCLICTATSMIYKPGVYLNNFRVGSIASVNLKLLMHLILVDFSPIIHSRPPFEVVANMGRAHGFNVDIDFVSKNFCQPFTSLPAGSSGSAL